VRNNTSQAEAYTHLGKLDEAAYKWHEAETDYRAALNRDFQQLDARDGLVRVLVHLYRPDEAIIAAKDGIRVSPSSVRPYVELAQAYLAKNDPTAAATPLAVAQARAPQDPAVLLRLGHAALLRNDDAGARQNLQAALAAQPNYPEAAALLGDNDYNHQRYVDAASWYSRTIAMTPPDYPPAHAGLGRVAEQQGNSQKALVEYARSVEVDATYAEGHGFLGDFYRARSQWLPAAEQYRQALALRPHWGQAYYNLAEVEMQLTQTAEAVRDYTAATREEPQFPEAWAGLGEAERVSQNRKAAITAFQQAVKLKADYAQAWLWLGYAYREDGQRDQAADAFRHARDTAADPAIQNAATTALAQP
jgi:tetratricopeptide (TPR) repeat protein